jgi:hypothetical protein
MSRAAKHLHLLEMEEAEIILSGNTKQKEVRRLARTALIVGLHFQKNKGRI